MGWSNGGWDDGYIPDGAELAEAAEGQWPYTSGFEEESEAWAAQEGPTVNYKAGDTPLFEYHCDESPDSADRHLYLHSHQRVTVLRLNDHDPVADTFAERMEDGMPLTYRVLFADGMEGDVFEDELMDSTTDYCRPDPPTTTEGETR